MQVGVDEVLKPVVKVQVGVVGIVTRVGTVISMYPPDKYCTPETISNVMVVVRPIAVVD